MGFLSEQSWPRHLWWGLEKENLRLGRNGRLAESSHPADLERPLYARDFAEGQLEIITPPVVSPDDVLAIMSELTDHALSRIGHEHLWNYSMPPGNIIEDDIRIADFIYNPDSIMSEERRKQEVLYRNGLALRYGKLRQIISGIHLNFSFPDDYIERLFQSEKHRFNSPLQFKNEFYTALTGYLYQKLWLLLFFSAASPFEFEGNGLQKRRHVFSRRNMNDGYAGNSYRNFLSLDSLFSYFERIREGTVTISDIFHFMGVVKNGKAVQMNASIFQLEKEFYAPLRIRTKKNSIKAEEADYLELRIFDVNPLEPAGIAREIIHLVHLLAVSWTANGEMKNWLAAPFEYMKANTRALKKAFMNFDAISTMDPLDFDKDHLAVLWEIEKAGLKKTAVKLDELDLVEQTGYQDSLEILTQQVHNTDSLPAAKISRLYRKDKLDLCLSGSGYYPAGNLSETV
jgi:glutamate--cysteine ligase